MGVRALIVAIAVTAAAGPAAAHAATPIPRPPDSGAPPGSPPHWLPADEWVHLHWTPFDEARLYELLGIGRRALWQWLRDDNQTIAQLAASRGHRDVGVLADELIAPRVRAPRGTRARAAQHEHHGGGRATPAVLRARTLRVLEQGHLSQHLIFHSLHQEAGPEAAPRLFGTPRTSGFQRLCRLDLGPLNIGRTHGRTRADMQRGLEAALRRAAARGVAGGHVSAHQAQVLLQRQLRQVPRWLSEDHYNGPPQTAKGRPIHPFRPSYASPALSADGRTVLFDSQVPAPPVAVAFGEVNLGGMDLAAAARLDPRDGSPMARRDAPCSSFNPSLSADGERIAYELSAGNRTFAKRYGNVVVAIADRATRTIRVAAGGERDAAVETAYAPSLSDDGNVVAYATVRANPMSASTAWASRVAVRDLRSSRTITAPVAGAYEPALSGDGRRVAFSALRDGRLQVHVLDLRSRRVTVASRAAEAWAPSLSRDGRHVAFAASRRAGGAFGVYVRDLRRGRTLRASSTATTFAGAPSLSGDGQTVAYTAQVAGARPGVLGRPRQQVLLRDLRRPAAVVASSAADGAPLRGWSGQPQLSDDGTRLAFTTDAATTGFGPGGLQVMVRDRRANTTTTVSPAAPLNGFDAGGNTLSAAGRGACDLRPPAW